jgi:hypothetical protein
MKWQTRAGQVYQWNKINMEALNVFNKGQKVTTIISEIEKERTKE